MSQKKEGRKLFDDYRQCNEQYLLEQVRQIFQDNPDSYREALDMLGFDWQNDTEEDVYEELEREQKARPRNLNQEYLVAYLEGQVMLTSHTLQAFITETRAAQPHYALFRRYFHQANPNLKRLLLYGLDVNPVDTSLLHHLAFFHEFQSSLDEVIDRYALACAHTTNPDQFAQLVEDFYCNTSPDGFDAFVFLKETFGHEPDRLNIIEKIEASFAEQPEMVPF